MPGRRSTILYWPRSSVVTVRTRSISAGLLASTVTPGITAPVVSLTTPAIALACANAGADHPSENTHAHISPLAILRISPPDNPRDASKIRCGSAGVKQMRRYTAGIRGHGGRIQNGEAARRPRRAPVGRAGGRQRTGAAAAGLEPRCDH